MFIVTSVALFEPNKKTKLYISDCRSLSIGLGVLCILDNNGRSNVYSLDLAYVYNEHGSLLYTQIPNAVWPQQNTQDGGCENCVCLGDLHLNQQPDLHIWARGSSVRVFRESVYHHV